VIMHTIPGFQRGILRALRYISLMANVPHPLPSAAHGPFVWILSWTPAVRAIMFFLAATSIWCLLAEFYGLCSMRPFTFATLLPSTALLVALTILDRLQGDRRLWHAVLIGAFAGLVAAIAYDVFRLPFVYANPWHLSSLVPSMDLFKVFPRFGAMILGQPVDQ